MNYKKIYDKLMERASGREYVSGVHEKHHIVPKSMGGSNDLSNIAYLTFREHFIAHWLLTKFCEGKDLRRMQKALSTMSRKGKYHSARVVSGWQYALCRKIHIEAMRGNKNAAGWKPSEEQRRLKSISMLGSQRAKGFKHTEAHKQNLRDNHPTAKRIRCVNDNNEFPSISAAARFYGIFGQTIGLVCRGLVKTTYGLKFEYANKAA